MESVNISIFQNSLWDCSWNIYCKTPWQKEENHKRTQGLYRGMREEVCISFEKYPVSCMVWGAIGFNFKSKLIFIKGTLGAKEYQEMLEKNKVFDSIRSVFKDPFIFQQDGAPCHAAQATME